MRLRRPTTLELVLQAVLLLLIAIVANDLWRAASGPVCTSHAELEHGDCYPWGWEGPFADLWVWRSRSNYLAAAWIKIALLGLGLVLPLAQPRRALNLAAMIALALIAVLVVTNWGLF